MIEVKKDSLYVKNPNTGFYDSMSIVTGESAYQTAVRNGYYGSVNQWLSDIGCVGGKPELAGESEYSNSINTSGTGTKINPVYINNEGIPTPIKYTLGNSCTIPSTDDPNDNGRKLITNIALQKAIDNIINEEYNPNAKAVVPSPAGVLKYNGLKQTPTWVNYDSSVVEVGGVTSAINSGNYTATFTPISPYTWKDGTNDPINVVWTIEKSDNTINVPKDIIKLTNTELEFIINVDKLGNGELVAVVDNPNIAKVVVSGNNVIITGDGETSGNTVVTIYVEEGSNYKRSNKVAINITTNYVKIVSWGKGNISEISDMLNAHYDGRINISDYWAIGDSRVVNINQIPSGTTNESQPIQNIKLIIIGIEHDNLANPINDKTKSAITVQVDNGLSNLGRMASTYADISASLWSTSSRRTWCNNNFRNALPDGISNLIKPVIKLTNRGCSSTISNYENYRTQQTTTDSVFLLSDYEAFAPEDTYCNKSAWLYGEFDPDGTQYEYLKTIGNRVRTVGGNPITWVMRSAAFNESSVVYFAGVNNSGTYVAALATADFGILPAFCL